MDYLKSCYDKSSADNLPNLQNAYKPEIDPTLTKNIESLLATAMLLGMEHATGGLKLSDEEIPALPFEEAVSFMKGRIPLTKQEWNALEPKLRFRAFTAGRLAQCDYIETVRGRLVNAMQDGQGFASTWNDIKAIAEADGAFQWSPRYWENVFRTNTQTAYVAGKLMQHEKNPPPAWRLMIIDDSRTSDICRGLVKDGGNSLVLASNHPFWSKYGFPPYHFQCRTGLQAVYSSQIGDDVQVENPNISDLQKNFKPQKGFGGNPIEKESWWNLTDSMLKRAEQYGIDTEIFEAQSRMKSKTSSDPIRSAINAKPDTEEKIREIGEMVIKKATNENKSIYEVMQEYRSFGTDNNHTWEVGSSAFAKEQILKIYKYFPSEWIEYSIADSENNPITILQKMRGSYYRDKEGWVEILINASKEHKMAHELAHRMEDVVPGITKLEKEFYARRTAGQPLQHLADLYPGLDYGPHEMARLGNFNEIYMGKDYGGNFYEILSTGVEKLFFNEYNIKEDLDFDSFIIGLLLGV